MKESNKSGLARAKRGAIAPADQQVAEQQAQQALQTPFQQVDQLHAGLIGGMLNRTGEMAGTAAGVAANLPAHYLEQFSQQLGASEVAPIDGFLDWLHDPAAVASTEGGLTPLGIGAD